ncbi:A24 family peptidase [Sphingosinicella terrae]|jgi:prepilin peptidase CpaA|uniref:A24 family peptidase n=1 Tax=Sphingosinicella terrae TaxID=2172047 RepID=UPI000E0D4DF5|nr:prepilin peptidase [Sphingosinicella terrae]
MGTGLAWILLALLALLLLAACWWDLRTRTIPNPLNVTVALLAIPFWWATGLAAWPDAAMQVGVALLVFVVFAGAFAIGAMGGGDVKLIGAVTLWLPWQAVLALLVIMSIAGGLLTVAMLLRKRLARSEAPIEVPYGVAIAFGGLWLIAQRFLYQFG